MHMMQQYLQTVQLARKHLDDDELDEVDIDGGEIIVEIDQLIQSMKIVMIEIQFLEIDVLQDVILKKYVEIEILTQLISNEKEKNVMIEIQFLEIDVVQLVL